MPGRWLAPLIRSFVTAVSSRWGGARRRWYEGIEIRGSDAFLAATERALGQLRRTSHFETVRRHVRIIREGRRSGIAVHRWWPTFTVGRRTWASHPGWYASGIAHEAHHQKLFLEARARSCLWRFREWTWSGAEAEKRCLAFQLEVLEELGAPEPVLSYVRELMKDPRYQGNPRSYRDYWRRDW